MLDYIKLLQRVLFTLFIATLLFGCGEKHSKDENSSSVSLAMLAQNPAMFDGNQVTTSGVVRHFEKPLHYWIEDENLHRVEVFPQPAIAPYIGQSVVVTGQFHFSATTGRSITVGEIKAQ
jgi:hypothetical protein